MGLTNILPPRKAELSQDEDIGDGQLLEYQQESVPKAQLLELTLAFISQHAEVGAKCFLRTKS